MGGVADGVERVQGDQDVERGALVLILGSDQPDGFMDRVKLS